MKTVLLIFLVGTAAFVGWWSWHFREIMVAYRLSVTVMINGDLHVGSGVVATGWRRNLLEGINGTGPWTPHIYGEAIPIDLGSSGQIFITLGGFYRSTPVFLPMVIIGEPAIGEWGERYFERLASDKAVHVVPFEYLPMIVRFRDPTRPATAECISPERFRDSFPIDAGAKLMEVTLQTVNATATMGLEKYLPWIKTPADKISELLEGGYQWNNFQWTKESPCHVQLRLFRAQI